MFKPLHSPDVRLFLSLDNPKNAQVNNDTEQFGADEADLLVFIFFLIPFAYLSITFIRLKVVANNSIEILSVKSS